MLQQSISPRQTLCPVTHEPSTTPSTRVGNTLLTNNNPDWGTQNQPQQTDHTLVGPSHGSSAAAAAPTSSNVLLKEELQSACVQEYGCCVVEGM